MENIKVQLECGLFRLEQGKGVDSQVYEVITVAPDGRVAAIGIFGGMSPPAGPTPDGGYVVYTYTCQEIDTSQLINSYYYDFDTNVFVKAPDKPHDFVYWDGSAKDYVVDQDGYDDVVDSTRQRLLYLTDWVHVPDNSLDKTDTDPATEYNQALAYRQEVRDFKVDNEDDYLKPIEDLDWPIVPDFLKKTKSIAMAVRMFNNQ